MDKIKWRIISHSFKDIIVYLSKLVVSGADKINDMRIIYTIDDSNVTYMFSAFDFIDLNPKEDTIKSISLCQMDDKSTI